jgi:hypothetical protein
MDFLKDRRAIIVVGAGAAVALGLGAAFLVAMGQNNGDEAPPASQGGLVVTAGNEAVAKLDPARPLRCFVGGRLVGEMPVADCAKKNGVATGSLSVGVDSSGDLAAATTPPPEVMAPPPEPPREEADAGSDELGGDSSGGQPCWNYGGGSWSRQPGGMSLNACVQALFSGQCVRPGGAAYGRWGEKTLRLVLGRVEISADGRNFRTLATQEGDCDVPVIE